MEKEVPAAEENAGCYPSEFFETIFGGHLVKRGLQLEIRCIHRDADKPVVQRFYGSRRKFKKGWKDIRKLNRQGYNIYYGVVPRDPRNNHKPVQPPLLTCLWADIDVGPDKANKDFGKTLRRVRKFKPRPTIIVQSGHGLHVYYRLRKPRAVESSEAKALLRGLAKALGGDLQSAEVARLLRVPNTLNWKGEGNA